MKTKKEISAGGIVFKKNDGQTLWLICQHSQHLGWGFPKGLVGDSNKDEKMETAALREVGEEGGVQTEIVFPRPVIIKYSYQWHNSPHGGNNSDKILVNKTVYYFLMKFISGDPKNHDWEMKDAKFVTQDEVLKILAYKSDKDAFNEILRIFKTI